MPKTYRKLTSGIGHGAHESNRVHQLLGEEEQGHHGAAPTIIPATRGVRTASQPDSGTVVPDAQLQPDTVRPESILLMPNAGLFGLIAYLYHILVASGLSLYSYRRCGGFIMWDSASPDVDESTIIRLSS